MDTLFSNKWLHLSIFTVGLFVIILGTVNACMYLVWTLLHADHVWGIVHPSLGYVDHSLKYLFHVAGNALSVLRLEIHNLFQHVSYWYVLVLTVLIWGVSLIFWGTVGLLRFIENVIRAGFRKVFNIPDVVADILPADVAIIVPAHNEELVIRHTIESLLNLVSSHNIFVVSDGSKDKTVEIARGMEVKVLELRVSRGKAGALETCISHFHLLARFKAIVLVDADTRLRPDYLKNALPMFCNPEVIAVAGYAQTIWDPRGLSWSQKLFILHRDRVYFLSQMFIKFGQTWRYTNVTHIVPGFASVYRSSALRSITMNPPGLVIEDFNMTFEIHHKHLGIIAHNRNVVAYTQDPDRWQDYFKQIKRWHLGLWQTVRLHGLWVSTFCAALTLTLFEVVLGSLLFLCVPVVLLLAVLPWFLPNSTAFLGQGLVLAKHFSLSPAFFAWTLLVVWLADYTLTILVAIAQKRPHYLLFGIAFPLVRVLDAVAFLGAIPKAFFVVSTGTWVSPTRRVG